jgi:hypothetical protein
MSTNFFFPLELTNIGKEQQETVKQWSQGIGFIQDEED